MLDLFLWSLLILASLYSAGHTLLHKRDPRAALGWIVLCLFAPGLGPALYWLLGVNRIRTRARDWQIRGQGMPWVEAPRCSWDAEMSGTLPFRAENFAALLSLSDTVTRRPLLEGNRLFPLHNGEETYPAMLQAIDEARSSVFLSTYIFDSNGSGQRFVRALAAAAARGVDVRVLVDALGERYSWPPIRWRFRRSGVRIVRFLPPSLSGRGIHLNLRNHRKLLIVDGLIGFTGGMNIGDRHLAAGRGGRASMTDVHFRLDGPVAGQIRDVFLEDWTFATGAQELPEPGTAADQGESPCRVIVDGPNEDMDRLATLLVGASAAARERIAIMTPYFLPARELVGALQAAALRGLDVSVVLPQKSNLPFVDWATRNMLWELLKHRVRVYCQPPPFAHSKLFVVDGGYAQIGSANIDPRSLRLNFELAVEVFDETFAASLLAHFDAVRTGAREVSLEEVDGRPLWERARDSLAWLASPYL